MSIIISSKRNPFNPANFRYYLIIFIFWRLILFTISFFAPLFISGWGGSFPYAKEYLVASKLPFWLWSFGNFDGVHYVNIAQTFYGKYFTQTFFPLYPMLIRFLYHILFNNLVLTGLFISNFFCLVFLYIFGKLLIIDGYKKNIHLILISLLIFPTSFYLVSVYSESLFLFLIIGSFYFSRKGNFPLAGLMGFLASLTRVTGLFLLPALLVDYYLVFKKIIFKKIIWLGLIPLGLLVYMLFLKIKFNDPLLFWHAQGAFGAQRESSSLILPPQVIWRYLKIFASVKILSLPFFNAFYEFSIYILGILILALSHLRKVRLSYLVFAWPCLLIPSFTGTLSSMPRYVLVCFPIFIFLGLSKNNSLKLFYYVLSTILLIFTLILFTRGFWVS